MIDGLITLDCEQGSEEWLQARLGIPTATGFENIVTATGKKSSAQIKYMAELIEESIIGLQDESFKSRFMERGNQLEPLARSAYEFITGNAVTQVGGVYLDENKEVMVSPDGLIPELKKGLEIKCPKMSTHIRYLLEGGVPSEYIIQVQANLWVTGYDTWDFVSYCPEYQKQPLYIFTAHRDQALMTAFNKLIPQFLNTLRAYKNG
ncbi:MAG: YqaJ viral recombinase family protein [Haemophilus parainfluenzae]|jgi:putative exonuclease|uniref:YqaJ viral recombinase family protein n=1 Tax=uncultured Haemophilus sp. TaxID=237779 RepID=UPI00206892D5|nr:YqaJ viral recombinase family protein [uncultured Haemophilus sp.]MDU4440255.1 YqaJ viral recombinase family protein [Haemophilus parainfluenzae]MDU4451178.1 YqaJ viral recombinase family protein [Haemophilus parainfluenzae]MDU4497646.1 YqaJ viral recombinase family protein [Haemophilus parainfluenzae]DAN81367.1 MAG TPA: Exonuclease [Caudoviricetes sp.]